MENTPPNTTDKSTALVVDDAEISRVLTKSMLEHLGYKVEVAASGTIALKMFETKIYDLVLMDVHMPEISGLECARQIKARTKGKKDPVILIATADETDEHRAEGEKAGVAGFISKPFSLDALKSLISSSRR